MKVFVAILFILAVTSARVRYPVSPDPRCPRFDDPDEIILLPHLTDCSKFVTCLSGLGYEMSCPEGLEFSIERTTCDYPEYAQCRAMHKVQINIASNGFNILQLPQKLIQNDASEHITKPAMDQIESLSEREPERRKPVVSYDTVKGTIDPRCPRTDNDRNPVLLPMFSDCNKFLKCFRGKAFLMDCPAGLEFSTRTNRCDYSGRVKCSV
ncbi:peritrophin-1-like [Malaya genurostris]|uniref:peritrophin-1-like n=1 Tax=Malaya genurostris TaxID=325434 RepID=UPI0026F3F003|nr:peritrophin-1-like [Malaya genurostris]